MNAPAYLAVAGKIYDVFLSHLLAPRKKQNPVLKIMKQLRRPWTGPHQGERECARRLRQRRQGILNH